MMPLAVTLRMRLLQCPRCRGCPRRPPPRLEGIVEFRAGGCAAVPAVACVPLPATVVMLPLGVTLRMPLLEVSAT